MMKEERIMKNRGLRIRGVLFLVLLTLLFPVSAAAASKKPAKVKKVKAEAKEKSITLTWNESEDVNGYLIYMRKGTTGSFKKIARVKGTTTYKKKGLAFDKTYCFYVVAYRRISGKSYYSPQSKVVKAKTAVTAPDELTGLLGMSKSKMAYLVWNKVENATEYIIWQKVSGKWKQIGKTKKRHFSVEDLKNDKTYQFRVRPSKTYKGKSATGKGAKVSVKVETLEKQVKALVTKEIYEVYLTRDVTLTLMDGSGTVTMKAGQHLGVAWKNYKNGDMTNDYIVDYFVLPDGRMARGINGVCNPVSDLYWNHSKSYSRFAAEYYVNNIRPQTSKTDWMLWINYYTQYCYVFCREDDTADWEWYATWETSTGNYGMTQTPRGELEIVKKSRKFVFPNGGGAYGNWASHLTGEGNAIHGPRRTAYGAYIDGNRIGEPLSSGCVRLFEPFAKFVYDNMDIGTRVLVE